MPTQPESQTVVVVSTAFEAVEALRRALTPVVSVARHADAVEARAALHGDAGRRVAGLVLEPVDRADRPTAPLVSVARAQRPDLPVIALVRRNARWCAATVALLEARPTAVGVVEDLDLDAIARALAVPVRDALFVDRVWGEVAADVPAGLRPLLRSALARATGPLTVQGLADAMGVHRKTLWRRCRAEGVEDVQALVTWCRLLAAEHVLRACSRPVDAVAEDLAFASPTALRNAIRRYLGTTPTTLRAPSHGRLACEGFRAWVRKAGGARAGGDGGRRGAVAMRDADERTGAHPDSDAVAFAGTRALSPAVTLGDVA